MSSPVQAVLAEAWGNISESIRSEVALKQLSHTSKLLLYNYDVGNTRTDVDVRNLTKSYHH